MVPGLGSDEVIAKPVPHEAPVPSPVRERDRVRDQGHPDESRPVGNPRARLILKLLVPHPDPLPHGRGGYGAVVSTGIAVSPNRQEAIGDGTT